MLTGVPAVDDTADGEVFFTGACIGGKFGFGRLSTELATNGLDWNATTLQY